MPVKFESAARARFAKQLCKPCKLRQSQPGPVIIQTQRAIGVCSQEQKHVGNQEQKYAPLKPTHICSSWMSKNWLIANWMTTIAQAWTSLTTLDKRWVTTMAHKSNDLCLQNLIKTHKSNLCCLSPAYQNYLEPMCSRRYTGELGT